MQSAYLCVILHVNRKRIVFMAVLTGFILLGKIQELEGDHYG